MPLPTDCPICAGPLASPTLMVGERRYYPVDCQRCGSYRITHMAVRAFAHTPLTSIQIGTISGSLRSGPADRLITPEIMRELRDLSPLPVGEQADRLLLHLAREHPQPGEVIELQFTDPGLQAVAWAHGEVHLVYLLGKYLSEARGYLWLVDQSAAHQRALIQPAGWAHVHDLQHTALASTQGFIAMHFSTELEPLRDEALIPAIADAGYTAFVVNKHPHNQDIMAEIAGGIRRSRFVVADFTGNRHSVYYEAGFAFGLGLPIIHTCRAGSIREVAFDVNHNNFLEWEPGTLVEFRVRLRAHIESTIGPGPNS